jgi:hypothetical protein
MMMMMMTSNANFELLIQQQCSIPLIIFIIQRFFDPCSGVLQRSKNFNIFSLHGNFLAKLVKIYQEFRTLKKLGPDYFFGGYNVLQGWMRIC